MEVKFDVWHFQWYMPIIICMYGTEITWYGPFGPPWQELGLKTGCGSLLGGIENQLKTHFSESFTPWRVVVVV